MSEKVKTADAIVLILDKIEKAQYLVSFVQNEVFDGYKETGLDNYRSLSERTGAINLEMADDYMIQASDSLNELLAELNA